MKTFETIDRSQLEAATGGGAFAQVLARVNAGELSNKQFTRLSRAMAKAPQARGGSVPAIAEGDFGAAPSSFIPLRGD